MTTTRYIDIFELERYKQQGGLKIYTPDGFQPVGDVVYKPAKECLAFLFSDGSIVQCSTDHLFQMSDLSWKAAKEIQEGDYVLGVQTNLQVCAIESLGVLDTCDLEVLHDNHRYYSENVSSHNTGKTLVSVSCACKLLDRDKRYQKIVYIRKTVVSEDKNAELGFLKGDLDEKLSPFTLPMENSIEHFLKSKHKDKKYTSTQLEEDKKEFKAKYPIEYPWAGHLRGGTITNAVVILDEAQNFSVSDLQMLLTRIGNDCKVLVIGSTRQIDNAYLNKYNNGLTYLMDKACKDNGDVRLVACTLDTTIRSKIAAWADEFNENR